jgi:hypothetical protein
MGRSPAHASGCACVRDSDALIGRMAVFDLVFVFLFALAHMYEYAITYALSYEYVYAMTYALTYALAYAYAILLTYAYAVANANRALERVLERVLTSVRACSYVHVHAVLLPQAYARTLVVRTIAHAYFPRQSAKGFN